MSDSEDFDDFNEFDEFTEQDQIGFTDDEDGELQLPLEEQAQSAVLLPTEDPLASLAAVIRFEDSVFDNTDEFHAKLNSVLNGLFPNASTDINRSKSIKNNENNENSPNSTQIHNETTELLSPRSRTIYEQVSALPRLRPPNWTKLKTRRHLMTKLGVPVNLDEVLDTPQGSQVAGSISGSFSGSISAPFSGTGSGPGSSSISGSTPSSISGSPISAKNSAFADQKLSLKGNRHRRTSLVVEANIDWAAFVVPEFDTLHIDTDQEKQLLSSTLDVLSGLEVANLDHSSSAQLLHTATDEDIDAILKSHQDNYTKLLELSSVWQHRLVELKKDYEIYESVVQNLVGHTQRLQRDEILANLKKVKSKRGRR